MLIYGNDRSSTLTLHFLRPSYDTSFPQSSVPGLITGMPHYARHLIRKSGTGFPLVPYSAHITHQSPRPVVSALFLPESLQLQVTRADWLDLWTRHPFKRNKTFISLTGNSIISVLKPFSNENQTRQKTLTMVFIMSSKDKMFLYASITTSLLPVPASSGSFCCCFQDEDGD